VSAIELGAFEKTLFVAHVQFYCAESLL
jgi:hypothetical protein